MTRKRGAPPGNHNAFKHGFYSESFRQNEHKRLSSGTAQNFESEMDLLRILIKRTTDKMQAEPLDLEESLNALRTVSFALAVLERLQPASSFPPGLPADNETIE